jgi:hypothetical protein
MNIQSLFLSFIIIISGCGDLGHALTGKEVTRVTTGVGEIIVIDDKDGISSIEIICNNGLIIKADWIRNSLNEYGYDIYEPEVNRDYNRLAVMITARGAIANYLRGEYE